MGRGEGPARIRSLLAVYAAPLTASSSSGVKSLPLLLLLDEPLVAEDVAPSLVLLLLELLLLLLMPVVAACLLPLLGPGVAEVAVEGSAAATPAAGA
jgi:hypothetical protein